MPTPIGHSLSGMLIYALFTRTPQLLRRWKWVLFSAFFAAAPDLDFIPGWLFGNINEFHRGISHSVGGCLAVVLVFWAVLGGFQKQFSAARLFLFLLALYGSHLVLDYFARDTAPPYGGMFLWPFSDRFFISPVPLFLDAYREPWHLIFSPRNFWVYFTELLYFGVPLFWAWRHFSLTRR